jgi:type I restriction enzyme S subunit
MELRPGYKQTDVGVIPEGWDALPMGSLGTFSKGQGIRKDEAASGEIHCVRYGEIYTHHNDVIRSFNSRISADIAKSSKRLKKGDLLFAGSGETKEEIGKCVAFVGDEEAYAGGDIVILTPNKGNSKFFGYLFNSPIVARQKASKGQGDAVVHISSSALSSITIPLPRTEAEQEAIAETLNNVDTLIGALDRLIAKKRDLKQAAMQQLLTGQIRLPGFSGDWKVQQLADIIDFANGKPHEGHIDQMGRYHLITLDSIGIDGKLKVEHRRIGCWDNSLAKDDIVIILSDIAHGNLLGLCDLIPEDNRYVLNQRVGRLRVKADVKAIPHFLRLQINRQQVHFKKRGQGTSQRHIYCRDIDQLNIELPEPEEQTAIATVLSDMDAEIAALKARRDKTHALKQGMMQELLTGKTRLI